MNARKSSDRLLEALARYHNLLILIKGSPDPDVIASSFALRAVCDHIGLKSSIVALAEISHPQNRAIVKSLEIPLTIEKGAPSPHDAILCVQSPERAAVRMGDWKLVSAREDHDELIRPRSAQPS